MANKKVAYVPGAKEIYGEPILAQAEWDVDTLVKRLRCVRCPPFIATLVLTAGLGLPFACCYCNAPCEIRQLRDKYRATHLLLTTHNVVYRIDEHYGKCPSACCRIGAEEVIIRLQNVSDVSTETTAGCGTCCIDYCWPVTTVHIQDPGRGGPGSEIADIGIKNGVEFKSAIIAAQRGDYRSLLTTPNSMAPMAAFGGGQPHPMASPGVTAELQQLADLKARGAINDKEYEAAKARVLTAHNVSTQPPMQMQMQMQMAPADSYAAGGYPPYPYPPPQNYGYDQQQLYGQPQMMPPQDYGQPPMPQQTQTQQASSEAVDGAEKLRRH